jgi:DNA-binding Lrp family transcriptional regulator
MVSAYVLITATIGQVKRVARELRKVKGVKSVHVVTGPFDIIVFVEAPDLHNLSSVVVENIHRVKGVVDTNTAIVVEL